MDEKLIMKCQQALNALAEKWCGVSDAFTLDQAEELMKRQVERGENAEVLTAHLCAAAYGFENVTVRDAALITDHELKRGIQIASGKLVGKDGRRSTIADVTDILLRRWKDLGNEEKLIVADAVIGELNHDAGTAA